MVFLFLFLILKNSVSFPQLNRCQIFLKELVDPLLADTYAKLPKLPRYGLVAFGISE